jgi:formylglycine-generating enzyme required for sulfatase activity
MGITRTLSVSAIVLLLAAGFVSGQTVRITSLEGDGDLTWQCNTLYVSYRIQKAPSPLEHWRAISTEFNDLPGTALTMHATVPMDMSDMGLFRIRATPGTERMAVVYGGFFEMGDNWDVGGFNEVPVHEIYINGFLMDKYEITNGDMAYILTQAYRDSKVSASEDNVFNTEGVQHQLLRLHSPNCPIEFSPTLRMFVVFGPERDWPCVEVTWYGAQAYCNYRSDEEGLERCINFLTWTCDFTKKGYRLPTEAEWEKGARGALAGHYYPWPSYDGVPADHIDHSKANYGNYGPTPVGFYDGNQSPPGPDMANGWGLYDMAGNVREWCYDYYQGNWYSHPDCTDANTTGPATGTDRVRRGGYFGSVINHLRCAARSTEDPIEGDGSTGFRCVRNP